MTRDEAIQEIISLGNKFDLNVEIWTPEKKALNDVAEALRASNKAMDSLSQVDYSLSAAASDIVRRLRILLADTNKISHPNDQPSTPN